MDLWVDRGHFQSSGHFSVFSKLFLSTRFFAFPLCLLYNPMVGQDYVPSLGLSPVSVVHVHQLSLEYACPRHKCNLGLIEPPSPLPGLSLPDYVDGCRYHPLLWIKQGLWLWLQSSWSSWSVLTWQNILHWPRKGNGSSPRQECQTPAVLSSFMCKCFLYSCMPLAKFQGNEKLFLPNLSSFVVAFWGRDFLTSSFGHSQKSH